MKTLLVAVVLAWKCFTADAAVVDRSLESAWTSWKTEHGKSYSSGEEDHRRATWESNLLRIAKHNARYENKDEHFVTELNAFADLELWEISKLQRHFDRGNSFCAPQLRHGHVTLPSHVDWREKGFVSSVRNQGSLSPSAAFSAVGSLEGQHFNKTGQLVPLSVQNLADCCTNHTYPNLVSVDQMFQCIYKMKGVDTEESYPQGETGKCRFNPDTVGATLSECVDITTGSEASLELAVATVGPVSVSVDAGHTSFQLYKSGVYFESDCSDETLDHDVLVVGYGEENGHQYWIVKNSWGKSWGMEGYIKMSRNRNNNCGIASRASYPIV